MDIFPFDSLYSPRSLTKPAHFYQRVMRRVQGYEPFFGKTLRREHVKVLHAHFGQDGVRAMPILSTHHCDIPAVVLDGESGFLVTERDVEALTDRLEYLIMNPEQWPRMGEAAAVMWKKILTPSAKHSCWKIIMRASRNQCRNKFGDA